MLTAINCTIKLVGQGGDNQKIQLIIPGSDYEKFKECKNIDWNTTVIDKEFYVGFTLGNEQLYVTGLFSEEQHQGNIIVYVDSAGQLDGKHSYQLEEMTNLLSLNDKKEEVEITNLSKHPIIQLLEEKNAKITELEAAKQKAETDSQTKTQELQDQLDTANTEKTALQNQLAEAEGNKNKALEDAKKQAEEALKTKTQELEAAKKQVETGKQALEAKIKELDELKANNPDAAALQAKDEEITGLQAKIQEHEQQVDTLAQEKAQAQVEELNTKITTLNAEVEKLKNDLKTKTSQVQQLTQKNKELEAKNKTTEQPKQGNAALYTATVGMGLAAGLVAFTALERTVRLEMLVMVGIAVASALVAGGITYAVLPSTQVDGAKAQEVSGDKKSK